jgi:hypothetical protein
MGLSPDNSPFVLLGKRMSLKFWSRKLPPAPPPPPAKILSPAEYAAERKKVVAQAISEAVAAIPATIAELQKQPNWDLVLTVSVRAKRQESYSSMNIPTSTGTLRESEFKGEEFRTQLQAAVDKLDLAGWKGTVLPLGGDQYRDTYRLRISSPTLKEDDSSFR